MWRVSEKLLEVMVESYKRRSVVNLHALIYWALSFRCQDEHEHAEFKKHIGGGCVCFDHQEGTLNVLVRCLHFIS